MTKRRSSRKKLPARRNPVAKALRQPKFRPRVVERPDVYKRRAKHIAKAPEKTPEEE